jgi:exopolysaccharide biosynthesis polyprenyl glycosylphosphotransferase
MLKEKSNLILQLHKGLDICITVAAFICAYYIKKDLLPDPVRGLTTAPNYYTVLFLTIIIWYIIFGVFDLYSSFRKQSFSQILWKVIKAVACGVILLNFALYLLKIFDVSRIMMGIFYVSNVFLLSLSKGIICRVLAHFRKKGFNFRNILVVGGKERAKDIIDAIGERLGAGYSVIGCIGLEGDEVGKSIKNDIKYIGTVTQLKDILQKEVVDEIIFAIPLNLIDDASKHIATAEELGVSVRILPEWHINKLMYRSGNTHIQIEDFLGIPTMSFTSSPVEKGEIFIKNILDYLCSVVLFVVCLPFFIIISILIKLSSEGPVFFKQERCGLHGRRFMVYKFRTMVVDAEKKLQLIDTYNESDGPVFKIKKDPRIIPYVGTFLRKTGFDELPQLINVLKGEMSLVGPRPPIPSEVEKYDFWQRRRLSMKPGITCLWQCMPRRNDIRFKDWMKLDLKYIDNWSLKLDLKILFKTALVVFTGQGR